MIELSIVIPVYGCSGSLAVLYERLVKSVEALGLRFEIVFVDDCDNSDSWQILNDIARRDPRVSAYRLSRNFGQQIAITAGLAQCIGDRALVMDCDLQDSPEAIGLLYAKALEGYEIVLTRRVKTTRSWFREMGSVLYFRLLSLFNRYGADRRIGSFSVISRKVIDSFLSFQDRERHYLFILNWLGFKTAIIEYQQADRQWGRSSYSFRTLLIHGLEGFFFQTTVLLRWVIYLGLTVSCAGGLLTLYFLYNYVFRTPPSGFTSLAVLVTCFSGVIITTLGVTGLYISRIFEQVKGRPLYVIAQSTKVGR